MREVRAALAPAVPVLADKLAFGLAADVVQSCLYEEALQVSRKNDLQPLWGERGGAEQGESIHELDERK